MRATFLGTIIGLLLAGLGPAFASAAVTVGSDLTQAPSLAVACPGAAASCTQSQVQLPGQQVVAPFGGVIVRWRLRVGGGDSGTVALRVIRIIKGLSFAGVGTSAAEPVSATAGIQTFNTRLPVRQNDNIGLDRPATVSSPYVPAPGLPGAQATIWAWSPPLLDGESRLPEETLVDVELLLNADIERDRDHDGYGDETQDACPRDPNRHGRCLVVAGFTCTLSGTAGSDTLVGSGVRDVICGLRGNDVLRGRGGPDVLLGGPGADRLLGAVGRDRLFGGAGRDRIVGGGAIDKLFGGSGPDTLLARDGRRDRVVGGFGSDRARVDCGLDVRTGVERTFLPNCNPAQSPTTSPPPSPPPLPACSSSYPDFCIPPPPPDLDCADVSGTNFTVIGSDPHGFDGNNDGVGCET
jgi:hypothetical protein